jgi:hypothetical protein
MAAKQWLSYACLTYRSYHFIPESLPMILRASVLFRSCQIPIGRPLKIQQQIFPPARFFFILAVSFFITAPLVASESKPISLAGNWRFQLDRADAGIRQHWEMQPLTNHIHLPGALQNQGFGDDITADTPWTGDVRIDHWKRSPEYDKYRAPGRIEIPFFLQPEKHYIGAAWYQREINLPADWRGQRVELTLERPHWETQVWLDGRCLGTNDSLDTPHVYDLGSGLAPGKHLLSIRVDNHLIVDVGSMAHSVTDHSQGNWNGIIGRIELSATSPVWVDDLKAWPDVKSKSVKVKWRLGNDTGRAGSGEIHIKATADGGALKDSPAPVEFSTNVTWDSTGSTGETVLTLGTNAPLWDEFNPKLFKLTAALDHHRDKKSVIFGLREITAHDRQFFLNSHPIFFRGTLDCCVYPLTGYPPTDLDSWRHTIQICQSYGLNHIRFHSWCPPEAAFDAADELGFYFQIECGVFGLVGDGKPIDQWIYRESERIVEAYGNHPSFMLFTHGNEPHGSKREKYLADWVNFWKARDSRRLVTTGTAFPIMPESQYHVFHGARSDADLFGRDYGSNFAHLTAPVIVHEMGQWCAYPDFDDIKKFNGPLKANNFKIFRDSLTEHGMSGQWRDFMRSSGKLQVLCYQEEIEEALRTAGLGGFQLLDLHDFPGQGTAPVGVLDALWQSKGYVTPSEFRRFCNSTVPLAVMAKRVWNTNETFTADLQVTHYGPYPMTNAAVSWSLLARDGRVVASGELPRRTIPLGLGISLGKISVPLADFPAPAVFKFLVKVQPELSRLSEPSDVADSFSNDWNIWVYAPPSAAASPTNVLVTSMLDDDALKRLDDGGRVLLSPTRVSWEHPKLFFPPIFWNRYMFYYHADQTVGLLIKAAHPALAQFPTDYFQDWQWQDIVTNAHGIVLDGLSRKLHPTVQVIDDWNINRRMGLVFECRVGKGRLLVCSANLTEPLDARPASRQLLRSLLAYAAGDKFNPSVEEPKAELVRLFSPARRTKMAQLGAKIIEVDSEDIPDGHSAVNLLDGDAGTYWRSHDDDAMPHHVVIDLGREVALRGLTILPRQDKNEGRPYSVEFFCSNNPKAWKKPMATAKFRSSDQPQTVEFPDVIKARYLKLVIHSALDSKQSVEIAELEIVTDPK